MCGLAGVVGSRQPERSVVQAMAAALGHRGPDGQDLFAAGGVQLAHTRLAVLDLSPASNQPMVDEGTGCVLVYNGELYNYRELRAQLAAAGHRFRSDGDTEVLLRAYLHWGEACLERLNGMFAFALWDPRTASALLGRDRLGEKPLHLVRGTGATWFASEIKALLAAGAARTEPDRGALYRFLAFGDLGHPSDTPFAGVTQLPAGHAARIEASGTVRTWRYWAPGPGAARLPASPGETAERFAQLFADAVRLRLRSDVPLGTSLSGGLDSSLVLAAVRASQPAGQLHAFTASFPGSAADELPRAAAVAERLGATIHPVPVTAADLAAGLDAMIRANEGPVESPSTFAQFKVMEEAHRRQVTVLLDGQGADETWAGYDKYPAAAAVETVVAGHPAAALRALRRWHDVRGTLPTAGVVPVAATLAGRRLGRRVARPLATVSASWLAPAYRRRHGRAGPFDGLEDVDGAFDRRRLTATVARLDLQRLTLPRLLRYADRNSMAWSREVRLPFLDPRLIELACAVPVDHKIVDGWSKEPVRRSLEHLGLPDIARTRDKRAYMPPTADWLRHPALVERVGHAWARLHRDGLVRVATPVEGLLPRWRALAVDAWADAFGLSLS